MLGVSCLSIGLGNYIRINYCYFVIVTSDFCLLFDESFSAILDMIRFFAAVGALFVFWLLLSGMPVPFLVLSGAGCAVAVVLLSGRLNLVAGACGPIPLVWRKLAVYGPWLIKEIALAAWDVSKRILNPRLPISPTLVEFRPSQKTDAGLVIHANSITLTPGTISVEAERGRFLVHALTEEGALSLAGSEMNRRCAELEDV